METVNTDVLMRVTHVEKAILHPDCVEGGCMNLHSW